MKNLAYKMGHLKLLPVNPFGRDIQANVVEAKILFFESFEKRGRIVFTFLNNNYSFDLFFKNDVEGEQHSNFLFPRLKKLDEGHFILSGHFKDQGQERLVVGKFEGRIPADYLQYQDEIRYDEEYWN